MTMRGRRNVRWARPFESFKAAVVFQGDPLDWHHDTFVLEGRPWAPRNRVVPVDGILGVTWFSTSGPTWIGWDAGTSGPFCDDLCKSLPSIFWRSTAIRRTGCCHPDTVLWTSDGSPRRMGGLGIRDAASCSSLRMAVGPDCACVLERYAARLPRVDGRNRVDGGRRAVESARVESQMEQRRGGYCDCELLGTEAAMSRLIR